MITLLPYFGPVDSPRGIIGDSFDAILREQAALHSMPVIEGRNLLTDIGGLTTDTLYAQARWP